MSRRFYIEPTALDAEAVALPAALARRLATVLRLRDGDEITLFDGSGREARAMLERIDAKGGSARVVERYDGTPEPRAAVHLYASIAKAERFDWLVEKATEIGAAGIVPIVTARGVVRTKGEGARVDRWRRIAIEAAEQCGRSVVPDVAAPRPFGEALVAAPGMKLIPYEEARSSASTIAEAIAAGGDARALSIFIGPEGGWTDDEITAAKKAGAAEVTLGQRVLRSETAAIVALTLALEAAGDLRPIAK